MYSDRESVVLGPCGDAMRHASEDGNDPLIGERGQLVWSPVVSQPRFSGNRRSRHAQRGSSGGHLRYQDHSHKIFQQPRFRTRDAGITPGALVERLIPYLQRKVPCLSF